MPSSSMHSYQSGVECSHAWQALTLCSSINSSMLPRAWVTSKCISWHFDNLYPRFYGSCDGLSVLCQKSHMENERLWQKSQKFTSNTGKCVKKECKDCHLGRKKKILSQSSQTSCCTPWFVLYLTLVKTKNIPWKLYKLVASWARSFTGMISVPQATKFLFINKFWLWQVGTMDRHLLKWEFCIGCTLI